MTRAPIPTLAALLGGVTLLVVSASGIDAQPDRSPGFPTNDPRRTTTPGKAPAGAVQAGEFSIVIEGAKQGRFKGDAGKSDDPTIVGLSYRHEIEMNAGKRTHGPITITKSWGPSSAQLMTASASGEKLKTVWLQFYRSGSGGTRAAPEVFYTVTLTEATIQSVRSYSKEGGFFEDIELRFERIDVEHTPSKTTGTDTWK